jgi:hypothetical protein
LAVGDLQTGRDREAQAQAHAEIGKPKPTPKPTPNQPTHRINPPTESAQAHAEKFSCFTTENPKKISEEREISVLQTENPKEQRAKRKEREEKRESREKKREKNFRRNERRERNFRNKKAVGTVGSDQKNIDILIFTKCTVAFQK